MVQPSSLSTSTMSRGRRKHVTVRGKRHGLSSSSALSDVTSSSASSFTREQHLSQAGTTVRVTPLQYPLRPHSVSFGPQRRSRDQSGSSSTSGSSVGVDTVFIDRPVLSRTAPVHPGGTRGDVTMGFSSPSRTTALLSLSSRHIISSSPKQTDNTRVSPVTLTGSKRTPSPLRITQRSNLTSTGSPSGVFSFASSPLTPLSTSQMRKGGTLPSLNTDWSYDGDALLDSVLTERELVVFVGTWNMQECKELPQSIDDFLLPLSHGSAADLFVIGTQESTPNRKEWEILLQQTLGPTHVMVNSSSLGVIYLMTFLRRDLIWYCSEVKTADYLSRPGKLIKTKGATATSFSLFGSSFLFVTSHLSAHSDKVAERNSEMHRISTNLSFNLHTSESVLEHHNYVFWCGDMNYRVDMSRHEVDQLLERNDLRTILLRDQLTREILSGAVFNGFSEQPISFPPTYKYDTHSDNYDTSERARVPSWTDRVLFRSSPGNSVRGCGYSSTSSIKASDHRPVYAIFKVRLDPFSEVDGIPPNPATYSREVYIKALQRRKRLAHLTEVLQQDQRLQEEKDRVEEVDTSSSVAHRIDSRTRHVRHEMNSSVCTVL